MFWYFYVAFDLGLDPQHAKMGEHYHPLCCYYELPSASAVSVMAPACC